MTPDEHIDQLRAAIRMSLGAIGDAEVALQRLAAARALLLEALHSDPRRVSTRPIALDADHLDDDEPSAGDVVHVNGDREP